MEIAVGMARPLMEIAVGRARPLMELAVGMARQLMEIAVGSAHPTRDQRHLHPNFQNSLPLSEQPWHNIATVSKACTNATYQVVKFRRPPRTGSDRF